MKTVAIIGAGFCGTLTAVQLLRRSRKPLRLLLINRSGPFARGLAYGTRTDLHVLNVPAARMSAFPDRPDDFLEFARALDPATRPASFVRRSVFGDYLETLLTGAIAESPLGTELRFIKDDVVDIRLDTDRPALRLRGGSEIEADRIVLALGHYAPDNPAATSPHDLSWYARDPWAPGALDGIDAQAPVLLLGTGLTMIDTVLTLRRHGHQGVIHTLSRRGLVPQAHRRFDCRTEYSSDLAERLLAQPDLRRWLHLIREEAKALEHDDSFFDWRDLLASLRRATPALWQSLDAGQRSRFLRHLRAYWDTHRHRCAPELADLLTTELVGGRLSVHRGRVQAYEPKPDGVDVFWRPRGKSHVESGRYARVINCTGPAGDTRLLEEPLIANLRSAGRLTPDRDGLGVLVDSSYRLTDRFGHIHPALYYVGPLLRAQYWEATAVPELRQHVAALCASLLSEFGNDSESRVGVDTLVA